MTDFDDALSRQLASLNADLAGTTLAGPAAARRRAAQRTRHQITGGVVAGVAVVAVGAIGIIQPDFRAERPQPAETPTTNPSAVPDAALLTTEDVAGGTGITWEESDDGVSFACTPPAPDGSTQAHFMNTRAARFDQFVESSSDAERRFADVRSQVESCLDGLSQEDDSYGLSESWSVTGLGDEAWMTTYWAPLLEPDEFAGAAIVQVRLVRNGEYVSVVTDGGPAQDFNAAMSVDRSLLAATRMCDAVGDPCTGEPEQERIYPAAVGDLPGWLAAADVAQAFGMPEMTEGGAVTPVEEGGWNYVGLPLDPMAAGARVVESRTYFDPKAAFEVQVTEVVARFADETAARAHYDELTAAADSFSQDGDVIQNTGSIEGPGYQGNTWHSDNEEFGLGFLYGVVTSGDAVAVVVYGVGSGDDMEVTPDQLTQLMTVAGERLATS